MGAEPESHPSLSPRRVLGQCVGICRRSWRELLVVGLILFVPLGLLESLGPADGIEVDRFDDLHLIAALALGVAQIVGSLIGTVFYAGIVAAMAIRHREGEGRSLGEVTSELPNLRLVVADVALVLATALGLLLLVVPGLIAVVWFALVGPVVEMEGTTVRRAFGRSRELVRGHFLPVSLLVWPAVLLQSALEGIGDEISFGLLGEGWVSDWLGSVAGNLLAAPIFALILVILYLDLREIEQAGSR